MNKKLLTGLIFITIALTFGLTSLINYRLGTLYSMGPALFPVIVSSALAIIGIIMIVESFILPKISADFKIKNITIITLSLIVFVLLSEYVNMIVAIVAMVILSSIATTFSLLRIVKLSTALIVIAYAFKYFLGVNLPL